MKKALLIIAVSLLAVGLVLLIVAAALGSGGKYEKQTYTPEGSFTSISVELATTDLLFAPSEDDTCRVVCYERSGLHYDVAVEDYTLRIREQDTRSWFQFFNLFSVGERHMTVYLPQSSYQTLQVSFATGDVIVPAGFTFMDVALSGSTGEVYCAADALDDMQIALSTGSVTVENTQAEEIRVSGTTGEIQLTDCAAGYVYAKSTTGSITAKNVLANSLQLETTTGDVSLDRSDASAIHIRTTTGSVTGSLRTDKTFLTETSTGTVDVPQTTGEGACDVATTTGSIRLWIA